MSEETPSQGTPGIAPEQIWERGWEGHERAQRRRMACLPLWEKLAWLEEAQRVVRHLRGQPSLEAPSPDAEAGSGSEQV